jgi:NADH dehydrogenase [ubiquinone] 1 alpha subcomplex assembly factor 7
VLAALRKIQQETLGCEEIDAAATTANKMRVGADGPTVRWHDELAHVPHGPSLFIAQELFDALPVHQFEYTDMCALDASLAPLWCLS